MKEYNKIKISSNSADITLLDDGSDTELHGKYRINNNTLEIELIDDSTIVVPAARYEDIVITTSAGDCCVCLTRSIVNHISAESISGDISIIADTDNVSMKSEAGCCSKKRCACMESNPLKQTKKTKFSQDELSVSSSDFSFSLEGDDNWYAF